MSIADISTTATADAIALDDAYAAHNYSPLPVVAASARGAWVTDVEGRRYLTAWPPIRRSTSVITTTRSSPPRTGNSTT